MFVLEGGRGMGLPEMNPAQHDQIRPHVPHYQSGSIECIDAIKSAFTFDEFVGFCKGNIIKYMWRLGRKGVTPAEMISDAEKARNYCDFLIKSLDNNSE